MPEQKPSTRLPNKRALQYDRPRGIVRNTTNTWHSDGFVALALPVPTRKDGTPIDGCSSVKECRVADIGQIVQNATDDVMEGLHVIGVVESDKHFLATTQKVGTGYVLAFSSELFGKAVVLQTEKLDYVMGRFPGAILQVKLNSAAPVVAMVGNDVIALVMPVTYYDSPGSDLSGAVEQIVKEERERND